MPCELDQIWLVEIDPARRALRLAEAHAGRYIAGKPTLAERPRRGETSWEAGGVLLNGWFAMAKKKTKKKTSKKTAKKKAKKKARRTVMYSSKGKKLYAKRDAGGKFKDIQQYSRAHAMDIKRESADGN
jgi:hypothetical protein